MKGQFIESIFRYSLAASIMLRVLHRMIGLAGFSKRNKSWDINDATLAKSIDCPFDWMQYSMTSSSLYNFFSYFSSIRVISLTILLNYLKISKIGIESSEAILMILLKMTRHSSWFPEVLYALMQFYASKRCSLVIFSCTQKKAWVSSRISS